MDDIERRLRELGERTAQELTRGPIPSGRIARRARLRKGLTALGSLGLVGLLALGGYAGVLALGEGSTETVDGNVLAAAAETTEEQGSARVEFEMTTHSDGTFSQDGEGHGAGEIDFATQRSYMRLEMEGDSGVDLGAMEVITDGTTMYIKGFVFRDDKWIKTDFGGSSEGSEPLGVEQWSADGYLDYLKSASEDIEVLGQEQLDGVAVTHYRAILDPALASQQIQKPDEDGEDGISGEEVISREDVRFASSEAWIDEQGLVRKMTFESSSESSGLSMNMTFTMRFFDFGAPVDIDLPQPHEIDDRDFEDIFEAEEDESVPDNSFLLMGKDGFEGPVVGFSRSSYRSQGCLIGAPPWVTELELVRESTQEVVIDSHHLVEEGDGDMSAEVLCFFVEDPGELFEIDHHPNNFVLRLKGEDRMVSVPMTSVTTAGEMIKDS